MKKRYALMSAIVNLAFFGTLELGLRLFGFEYSRFPQLMQQESANDHIAWQNSHRVLQHFIPDPRRMWKPEPRTYQLMHYFIYPPRVHETSLGFQRLIETTRVPPRYFVDNIEAMIEIAHRAGAPILFVAPPYGAGVTNPGHDVLFPAKLIPRIHILYRELLRATVMRHADAAALVAFSPPEFDASLMGADGIHPIDAGYTRIAEAVSRLLLPALEATHAVNVSAGVEVANSIPIAASHARAPAERSRSVRDASDVVDGSVVCVPDDDTPSP